jgi:hypothetical protein
VALGDSQFSEPTFPLAPPVWPLSLGPFHLLSGPCSALGKWNRLSSTLRRDCQSAGVQLKVQMCKDGLLTPLHGLQNHCGQESVQGAQSSAERLDCGGSQLLREWLRALLGDGQLRAPGDTVMINDTISEHGGKLWHCFYSFLHGCQGNQPAPLLWM